MRVLWICNIMLPAVARHLGQEENVKEGWLTGLADRVLFHGNTNEIKLGVCFPVEGEKAGYKEKISVPAGGNKSVLYAYGFYEDTARPEKYDKRLEAAFTEIYKDFRPDVIHCFGTEYPHTLAAVKACKDRKKMLLGLQGICFALADVYFADLPKKVCRRFLFRDFLKQDNLKQQRNKFRKRGEMVQEALRLAQHVTGRTEWDKRTVQAVNSGLQYHFMNETLRPAFYEGQWSYEHCRPHSIFLSQGDYPIKGLHYMLRALPEVLRFYPDAHVYVAGQSLVRYDTLKERLKISSYGKYLLQIIKKEKLEGKITFLGKLNVEDMKKQYLLSHLFVCPSVLENSPNSLGEAMLLGVPCIAAAVGGIPSFFSDKDGILFQGSDPAALTEAILQMWKDPKQQARYSRHARTHALCNHDAEVNYHKLLKIYQNIYFN